MSTALDQSYGTHNKWPNVFAFYVSGCGLVPVDCTHIFQNYFTAIGAILLLPQYQPNQA